MDTQSDKFLNKLSSINDFLMEKEFEGLTPIECLLKIMRENKKHKEQNAV